MLEREGAEPLQQKLTAYLDDAIAKGFLVPAVSENHGILRYYGENGDIHGTQYPNKQEPNVYQVPGQNVFVVRGKEVDLYLGRAGDDLPDDMFVIVEGGGVVSASGKQKVLLSGDFEQVFFDSNVMGGLIGTARNLNSSDPETTVIVRGSRGRDTIADSLIARHGAGIFIDGDVAGANACHKGGFILVLGRVEGHEGGRKVGVLQLPSVEQLSSQRLWGRNKRRTITKPLW